MALEVTMKPRRSWADEEEDLRRLEALEETVLVWSNGKLERRTRDELIASHQKFDMGILYSAWATGKNADLVDRIFQPLQYVTRVLNESVREFEKQMDTIQANMRKGIYRVCKADNRQCLASFNLHKSAMMCFCVQFQKIATTATKMRMIPREDPTPMMEDLTDVTKWQLLKRFEGLCSNPKRAKEATKLRDACFDAANEFYVNTAGAMMLAEKKVVATHRDLIRYKIEFDQRNPDVVALMKE